MNLIDNIHLIVAMTCVITDIGNEIPYIFNRIVRGAIEFLDIQRCSGLYTRAVFTYIAGFLGRTIHAIESFRKYAGNSSLSHAPWTAEKICMTDTVTLDRIFERFGDMMLGNNISEKLRPPFSSGNNVGHSRR